MTTIEELERRSTALEVAQNDTTQTLRWVVSRLGRVAAVQDEHTLRLERIEGDVSELKADVRQLKTDMREVKANLEGLRDDLPGMIAETMREVLREANK
jgi:uncharacterized coiled-coil DUF342 family protein